MSVRANPNSRKLQCDSRCPSRHEDGWFPVAVRWFLRPVICGPVFDLVFVLARHGHAILRSPSLANPEVVANFAVLELDRNAGVDAVGIVEHSIRANDRFVFHPSHASGLSLGPRDQRLHHGTRKKDRFVFWITHFSKYFFWNFQDLVLATPTFKPSRKEQKIA